MVGQPDAHRLVPISEDLEKRDAVMNRMTSRPLWSLLALLAIFAPSGCSDDAGDKPRIKKVQGVAKSINVEKRIVSMTFTDDRGNERELEGTFKDDTEVFINGRSQEISDIRPGDKVTVYGYREGKGSDQKLIAEKVEVNRPRSSDWKPTGQGGAESPPPADK